MRNIRRPPVNEVTDQVCDAVVGCVDEYREFVIYDNSQAYPELLVTYRREK